ncbi:hypothetical protein HYY74_00550 [Candidatus Woesearchaeota archaeon]|nr:hypothetical protein [Candidatus Woesearchaeota archaeon]
MNEKMLLKVSLAVAVLGLVSLAAISALTELEPVNTYDIGRQHSGRDVRIRGTVTGFDASDNYLRLQVSQPKPIDVVLFDKANFSVGDEVDITGSVRVFNGKPQIIGERYKVEKKKECQ